MNIIGVNAFHGDSSACLIIDGNLIAAVEEERFLRVKHWAGFPAESIKYCLNEAGIDIGDIDHIAINQDSKANLWKKISYTISARPEIKFITDRLQNKLERANLKNDILGYIGDGFHGSIQPVEHHLAHLSSAYHVSPFEEAAILSIDGFGDFASTAWGYGKDNQITTDDKVYFPHSLGIFYQALTQWLGFPHYGDEYKVMGLAPYGKANYIDEMRKIVHLENNGGFRLNLDYFQHHNKKIDYEWNNCAPSIGTLYSNYLIELLGPARQKDEELTQRHKDIAHSIQAMYEETFFHILNHLHSRHPTKNICLAGGCAMNSVANGKVCNNTPFENIYIQSAAGDAGGAIGSAYYLWYQLGGKSKFVMNDSYWGPAFNNNEIQSLIEEKCSQLENCTTQYIEDDCELCDQTAMAISEGKVIGWFQGRMEWGPRALGNRSILGDPRRQDMKDILNLKIKRRESFRPFAPSILREEVSNWFEEDDDVPFMMQVFPIKKSQQAVIPAVTHVDGSGRLQTVTEKSNDKYYKLIKSFYNKTGVPIVLNTSFNENEPVVCSPEEALDCFLRTNMDVLVMENWLIQR